MHVLRPPPNDVPEEYMGLEVEISYEEDACPYMHQLSLGQELSLSALLKELDRSLDNEGAKLFADRNPMILSSLTNQLPHS